MIKAALILIPCAVILVGCGSSSHRSSATSTLSSTSTTTSTSPPAPPPPTSTGKGVTSAQIASDEERITFNGGEIFNGTPKHQHRARAKMLAATHRLLTDLDRWTAPKPEKLAEINSTLIATSGTPCPECHAALVSAQKQYGG